MEAQFQVAKITQLDTKFFHALSSLPPHVVGRVSATVLSGHDYDQLKKSVLEQVEATKPELFEELIRDKTLVGRPSNFLFDLRQLGAQAGVPDELVRHKFQQSLPQSMAPIVASQKTMDLDALGKLADELLPLCNHSASSHSINSASLAQNSYNTHQRTHNQPHYQERQQNNSTALRGVAPFAEGQRPRICRAHIYFADQARTCRNWCKWPNKQGATVLPNTRPNSPAHFSRASSPYRGSRPFSPVRYSRHDAQPRQFRNSRSPSPNSRA